MGDDGARQPAVEVLRVRPSAGSILLIIGASVVATVVVNLFAATERVLGWAFATIVVAWLAFAVIGLLDRWIPRGLAILVTVLAFVVVGTGIWVGVVATARSEVGRIRTSLPEAARNLEERYEAAADFRLAERVQSFVDELNDRFSTRRTASTAAETAPTYFVTGILMLFFVGYGPRYVAAGLNQIADPARRERVDAVFRRSSRRARAYLLVTVAQVIVTILLTYLAFSMLGRRAPFLLALIVGVLGAIPYIGFVLGGLAPLLVAAADPNELVFVAVAAIIIGLQLVEILLVRRRVDPRTLRVGPALMLIVALMGFELYGLGGAVYACAALVFALAVLDAVAADRARPGLA